MFVVPSDQVVPLSQISQLTPGFYGQNINMKYDENFIFYVISIDDIGLI